MNDFSPLLAIQFADARTRIFINARVEPVESPIGPRRPDMMRDSLSERAKLRFALAQCSLSQHLVGNIGVCADKANGLSCVVAFDDGLHRYPANLSIAWPDNSVQYVVVANVAFDGIAELFLSGFTVLRMNSPNPVFMGLIGCLRRQAMNDQIFRRTMVAEAAAQIDFEPADLPDLLNASEFGFPFAQRQRC